MPEPFELIEDEQKKLILRRPGQDDVADVRVRRAFPWSRPEQFVSIRSSEGKELLLLEDLLSLPEAQRRIVEQYLGETIFIPKITQIQAVDLRFGYQQWKVHTDRGAAEFRVQEREDLRFLNDGRFSVKDVDGNIYELPTLEQLDPASRAALEALI